VVSLDADIALRYQCAMARIEQPIGDIVIGDRLQEAESSLKARTQRPISARDICKWVRERHGVPLSPSTYSLLRSDRRSPTVQQLVALARVFEVTPEFLLGELGLKGKGGIRWARRMPALSTDRNHWFVAFDSLLSGHPLGEELCAATGLNRSLYDAPESEERAEWELGRLAQSALFLGVAELRVTSEAVDRELSQALRELLVDDKKLPAPLKTRLQVTVIRNPVHKSFKNGAHIGPLLVGSYGIQVLGEFLNRNAHANQVGIAGGFHVDSLVRQVGISPLPWPERIYRLYPLTLEPFAKHISLGDVLVGSLSYRLGAVMGPEKVQGYSLRAFGYLTEEGDVSLRQRSITTVLDQLTEIDIAVLGVGDSLTPDGPLQRVLATQGYNLAAPEEAVADVCLNPINEDGELLPLNPTKSGTGISQLIGVDTEQLRRMSQIEKNKLVLLLATGERKALSTRAIVRGGYVNHVLCDDRLANALLDRP
jgi:hypothetical protein